MVKPIDSKEGQKQRDEIRDKLLNEADSEEYKKLEAEGEGIHKDLEDIAFINHMEGGELDEFWGTIRAFADNEIAKEKFCNQ